MELPEWLFPWRNEESTPTGQRSFLGFTSFSMKDVFRSNEPRISLSLRTMDGVSEVGEVKVARLHMEAEREDDSPSLSLGPQGSTVCESLHGSVHDKDNGPMMTALLRSPVCKVYRFQTEDNRWMLVREQMSESPLSFSVPKQLLALLIQQDMKRVQEVMDLVNLSPHWEGLRRDVICHCSYLIGCYQETLTELNGYSASSGCFKSSSVKSDGRLQFVPTNLHSQRMQVCDIAHSSGVWYDVITVGAPAYHSHQAFKQGGLQRLVSKHTQHQNSSAVSYSPEEVTRARELLASVAQLQPLVVGSSEELLGVCAELNPELLQDAVEGLTHKTEEFVHALKDELVHGALASLHSLCPAHCHRNGHAPVTTGNGTLRGRPAANQGGPLTPLSPWQQETARHDVEFDEEEWDRVWANVAKSLNCVVAMVDRLRERVPRPQEVTSLDQRESPEDTDSHDTASSWQEQLHPLVVTLRECVREAVLKARAAMNFVLLQEALQTTVSQGTPQLRQRRDAVFSQTLSAVVCGFLLKLYGGLEDCAFLQQLHTVGLVVQFEGLLSTYGEELGMLEDMSVGVSDLSAVTFTITNAESDQPADLLPRLNGTRGRFVVEVPLPPETYGSLPRELQEGCVLKIQPVLFNIGINQQQSLAERFGDSSLQDRINHESCERLKNYCSELREKLPQTADLGSVSEQLWSLERSLNSRKRKNVEVLWNAASLCRRLKAVRLTSCKSAKDRTSMSVTLEQCVILRDQHTLSNAHFYTALDCMRRSHQSWGQMEGCYARPGGSISGVELGDRPPDPRDPQALREAGAPKAPGRHLYPVAFLLVTSHVLVLWLILSLVLLLGKYQ